jgi:hypothetical protein
VCWRSARDPLRLRSGQVLGPLERTRAVEMTQLGGGRAGFVRQDMPPDSGVISRRKQSTNPESSRTKPLFRRSEGYCGEFPTVGVIRARSLGPLEETRAVEMTQLGGERAGFVRQDMPPDGCVVTRCTQSISPASSRTKPFFRRSEGSRGESPGVVEIRARSLGPLEKTRAVEMTPLGCQRALPTI